MYFARSSKTSIERRESLRSVMMMGRERRVRLVRRGCIRALLVAFPCVAGAQSARDSALYVQAQQMVANGDATGGRKLADSVAAMAPAGSAAFAEGLFWRATLAENARDSEHEYRQIIVDYPLSGRVPDALLRIGQLESARGENAAALQHFQRLVLEHPQSPLRGEASYWVARMYFDTNDATRACTANADALANVRPSNIELKNRIDFQQQRCRGVALATNSTPVPIPVPVAKAPSVDTPKVVVKTITKPVGKQVAKAGVPTPAASNADSNAENSADAAAVAIKDTKTAAKTTSVVSRPPTREEVARALASAEQPVHAKATQGKALHATSPRSAKTKATTTRARTSSKEAAASESVTPASGSFAVQVAAFGTKPPAALLVAKLRGRGYNVYIDGTSAPYRVRLGHYPTHEAAAAELVKLKAKQIDGFVVER